MRFKVTLIHFQEVYSADLNYVDKKIEFEN